MALMNPTTPAGWYADPTRRHDYRYWDSVEWTENVSDRGITSIDPPTLVPPSAEVASTATPTTAPAPAVASVPAPAVPPTAAPVVQLAPAVPPAVAPVPQPASTLGTREIVVPEGRRFNLGAVLAGVGLSLYGAIGGLGFVLGLGSGGREPLIYLGSRTFGYSAEYYTPGILFVVLPVLMLLLQPRMDRSLKSRRSRESLTQQLGLTSSWKYTTAYVATSFTWRRIACAIGGVVLFFLAIGSALAISSDGFALAFPAYLFMGLGALAVIGTGIMLTSAYRRIQVDGEGRGVSS
jgi:hypothetical protein